MNAAERARENAAKTRAAIDGCHAILNDLNETPERRRKAREILDELTGRVSMAPSVYEALMQPHVRERPNGSRSGNDAAAAQSEYEGWDKRR